MKQANQAPVTYEGSVLADWIDYNGHMNVAYYVLVFDLAVDKLIESLGLGAQYRKQSGCSLFAVESHITYGQEVFDGEPLQVRSRVLGSDDKRLHVFHQMYHGDSGDQLATLEVMLLHIDSGRRRATSFPPNIMESLKTGAGFRLPPPHPAEVGRVMKLKSG